MRISSPLKHHLLKGLLFRCKCKREKKIKIATITLNLLHLFKRRQAHLIYRVGSAFFNTPIHFQILELYQTSVCLTHIFENNLLPAVHLSKQPYQYLVCHPGLVLLHVWHEFLLMNAHKHKQEKLLTNFNISVMDKLM